MEEWADVESLFYRTKLMIEDKADDCHSSQSHSIGLIQDYDSFQEGIAYENYKSCFTSNEH